MEGDTGRKENEGALFDQIGGGFDLELDNHLILRHDIDADIEIELKGLVMCWLRRLRLRSRRGETMQLKSVLIQRAEFILALPIIDALHHCDNGNLY